MERDQFPKDKYFRDIGLDYPLRSPANSFRTFIILFFLVFIVYSNTFQSAWHLDDFPSIVENQKIQLTDLTLDSLHRSLKHPQKDTLWRPLAHLSFALNWYAGRDDVFGYHLVNVMIHLLSSCVLYLNISTLFRTPNLQSRFSGTSNFISFLATVLWMINPIQTQAVTYIVQRMTLPAFVLIIAVIVGALLQARKRPLLSFAVLFFFLNHLIESSIIPLELLFEHRNYLPSMFLFVPVAEGTIGLLGRYREKQPLLYRSLLGIVIGTMVGFGWATYARNKVWRTEISLWTDANRKAPALHRPVHNLAMAKYESNGQLDKALELYQKASKLKMHRRSHRAHLYGNIANIYYRTGKLDLAEVYFSKVVDFAPFIEDNRYRLAETLFQRQNWQPALAHLNVLLDKNLNSYDYLILKGKILISCNDSVKALRFLRAAMRINSKRPEGPTYAGVALMTIKAYDRSLKLFKFALNLEPKNLLTYLRLVDANLRRGHLNTATALTRYIVTSATVNDIDASLGDLSKEPFCQRTEFENLKRVITNELENHIPGASSRFLQHSNN